MDKQQLKQLQEFVQICKSKPDVLHLPELGFYRQWLERYVIRCKVYIYATSVVDQWFSVLCIMKVKFGIWHMLLTAAVTGTA